MKIYIAGPITGVADYRERFAKAETELTRLGHVVLNPAALPEGLGDHRVYMSLCLPMVEAADAVLMLPGWQQSPGACMEWGYATALGKIVMEYEDYFTGGDKDGAVVAGPSELSSRSHASASQTRG